MAHRFRKNNIISDSESEDEDNWNDSLNENKDSSNSSIASCLSKTSQSSSSIKSKEDDYIINLDKDYVGKKLSSSSNNVKEVEEHIDVKQDDISLAESSFSIASESFIDNSELFSETGSIIVNSGSEISNNSLKKLSTYNNNVHTIVKESSDSESSIECIDFISSVNSDFSPAHQVPISQSNINDKEAGSENSINNISVKNSSIITIENSSSSHLEISNISSTTSPMGIEDYKILEQQLAEKKTAYQNILRAVKSCDLSKLKDGGKLLNEKLVYCKNEVNDLEEKLKNYKEDSLEKLSNKSTGVPSITASASPEHISNIAKSDFKSDRVPQILTVDSLVTLHNSLKTCPAEHVQEQDPKGLLVDLMPHQRYALAWLLWREQQIPAGGILADDMGLGKTLTMIALVLRSNEYKKQKEKIKKEENEDALVIDSVKMYHGKTLVVCPSSLIGQWQGQINQHCKPQTLNSLVHHGKPRELQAKKLAAYDIVITTYGVVVEENKIVKGNKKGALLRIKWERIILDEGHIIRNHKTKSAQAICELEAEYRWCLTGTPVQNRELDMYSLLKFLKCSPFDNLNTWKRWVDNKSANGIKRLNAILKSILLRRTKEELKNTGVLNTLPKRNLIPIYIELDYEEQKVYHTVLRFSKNLFAEYLAQEEKRNGFSNDKLRDEHRKLINAVNEIKTTEIFVLLLRLRQICCLPGLIHSMLEKDTCEENGINMEDDPILLDLTKQMGRISIAGHEKAEVEKNQKTLIKSNPVFEITRPSAKIRAVLKIIKEALESEDKIVVVSQWSNLLQKIKSHILPWSTGLVVLDGSVPVKYRSKIIEDFNNPNSNSRIMLLSLTAGGVGLNLVGGNRLIIIEPHWNPQLEFQACDRIYRVGQKKTVFIYKIICKNTIEEKIEMLQQKKLVVAETVLKGELNMGRHKITLSDLKTLFDIN